MTFMRFILEHPWISSLSIGVVAIGFLWTGLRDGKKLHSRIGAVLFCCAVLAWVVGSMIETPTEHAKRLIDALVQAVEHKNIPAIATLLTEDVILVDTRIYNENGVMVGKVIVGESRLAAGHNSIATTTLMNATEEQVMTYQFVWTFRMHTGETIVCTFSITNPKSCLRNLIVEPSG